MSRTVVSAGIGVLLMVGGVFMYLRAGGEEPRPLPISSGPEVTARSDPLELEWGSERDLEVRIVAAFEKGDAATQDRARATLRAYIQRARHQVMEDFGKWVKPIRLAGLQEEALTLTQEAIERNAVNSAVLADCIEVRVEALVALQRPAEAVSEAKSLFAIATQKKVDAAVLLAEKLARSGTAKSDELSGANYWRETFKQISSPATSYDTAIRRYSAGTDYQSALARGNLYLLSLNGGEARNAFREALQAEPDLKGKRLFAVIEGLVKTVRIEHSSIRAGNDCVAAIKIGSTDHPLVAELLALNVPVQQCYDAGRAIPIANVPPFFESPVLSARSDVKRLARSIALAESTAAASPLVARLRGIDLQVPLSAKTTSELVETLGAIEADLTFWYALSRTIWLESDNARLAGAFYGKCASEVQTALNTAGDADARAIVAERIAAERDHFETPLWKVVNDTHDRDAMNTLSSLYKNYIDHGPDHTAALRTKARMRNSLALIKQIDADDDAALLLLRENIQYEDVMNAGERLIRGFNEGMILLRKQQYAAALPLIEPCADWAGFTRRREAQKAVVECLRGMGKEDEARQRESKYLIAK